ncbi:MAG TPA: class I SAM-dependent methyltransferase, partial [Acidimicrobiales bacterium]|nr:class I SAM-dependent methyltransferase [Acidimicrobiales bacterium]
IGCGKGFFLELLREAGHDVIGVDPAYEGTNPAVVCAPFSPELGIRRDGVILRHVLEHVEAPWGFLEQIRDANGGGVIYIEVPTFDWILANRAWFDVFYEHVTYFRLSDLTRMFGQVHDAGALFGGQYIYVVADLGTLRPPSPAADVATVPDDFLRSIDATADRLRSRPAGSRAIWGAGAKGVVFALLMQRAGIDLDVAIDINPAKQGRYLPATGLRVCSPGEAMLDLPRGADVSVMNGNYLDEIRAMTDGRFNLWAIDHAET